jgi:hypothetical protein
MPTDEDLLRRALEVLEAHTTEHGVEASHWCVCCETANSVEEHTSDCAVAHALVALRTRLGLPTRIVEPRAPWLEDHQPRDAFYKSECPLCKTMIRRGESIVLLRPTGERETNTFVPSNPTWVHVRCADEKGYTLKPGKRGLETVPQP